MHDIELFKDWKFSIVPKHRGLSGILMDKDLAALGDAFVNFVYSLALSFKKGKPMGKKLSNITLASAFKKAGLRSMLPSRMDRHKQANAAEALIVYAWLAGILSLEEILQIMNTSEKIDESLERILEMIVRKSGTSHLKA